MLHGYMFYTTGITISLISTLCASYESIVLEKWKTQDSNFNPIPSILPHWFRRSQINNMFLRWNFKVSIAYQTIDNQLSLIGGQMTFPYWGTNGLPLLGDKWPPLIQGIVLVGETALWDYNSKWLLYQSIPQKCTVFDYIISHTCISKFFFT